MNENLFTSTNGLNFIAKWEGCILHVYKDIAGLPTIGVGHLIKPGENFSTITKDEALQLLAKDVSKCEAAIKNYIKIELNQNQFDALVSFSFNCGTGVLQNSGVAKAVNAGNFALVPIRLLDWCKYSVFENGVKVLKTNTGLFNRRKSEGELWSKPAPILLDNTEIADNKDGNGLLSQSEIDRINNIVRVSINNSLDDIMNDLRNIHPDDKEDNNA